jgi:hypothetical protein
MLEQTFIEFIYTSYTLNIVVYLNYKFNHHYDYISFLRKGKLTHLHLAISSTR